MHVVDSGEKEKRILRLTDSLKNLVEDAQREIGRKGFDRVWQGARVAATPFYLRFGVSQEGDPRVWMSSYADPSNPQLVELTESHSRLPFVATHLEENNFDQDIDAAIEFFKKRKYICRGGNTVVIDYKTEPTRRQRMAQLSKDGPLFDGELRDQLAPGFVKGIANTFSRLDSAISSHHTRRGMYGLKEGESRVGNTPVYLSFHQTRGGKEVEIYVKIVDPIFREDRLRRRVGKGRLSRFETAKKLRFNLFPSEVAAIESYVNLRNFMTQEFIEEIDRRHANSYNPD